MFILKKMRGKIFLLKIFSFIQAYAFIPQASCESWQVGNKPDPQSVLHCRWSLNKDLIEASENCTATVSSRCLSGEAHESWCSLGKWLDFSFPGVGPHKQHFLKEFEQGNGAACEAGCQGACANVLIRNTARSGQVVGTFS